MINWLDWDTLQPVASSDGAWSKRRPPGPPQPSYVVRGAEIGVELASGIDRAFERLVVAEHLAIDTILERHGDAVSRIEVTHYLATLEYDPDNAVVRRTRVMSGDVQLGVVVMRRAGEYAYEVVTE